MGAVGFATDVGPGVGRTPRGGAAPGRRRAGRSIEAHVTEPQVEVRARPLVGLDERNPPRS